MTVTATGPLTGHQARFAGYTVSVGSIEDGQYRVFFERGKRKTMLVSPSSLEDLGVALPSRLQLGWNSKTESSDEYEVYTCKGLSAIAMEEGFEGSISHAVEGPLPYNPELERKLTCPKCQKINGQAVAKRIDRIEKAKKAERSRKRKMRKSKTYHHRSHSAFTHSATYGPSR